MAFEFGTTGGVAAAGGSNPYLLGLGVAGDVLGASDVFGGGGGGLPPNFSFADTGPVSVNVGGLNVPAPNTPDVPLLKISTAPGDTFTGKVVVGVAVAIVAGIVIALIKK